MFWCHRANENRRRYNEPVSAADMAVVFTGDDGLPPLPNYVRIYLTNENGEFREMNFLDPNRDPMCYPLLFPYGCLGIIRSLIFPVCKGASRNEIVQQCLNQQDLFQ